MEIPLTLKFLTLIQNGSENSESDRKIQKKAVFQKKQEIREHGFLVMSDSEQ